MKIFLIFFLLVLFLSVFSCVSVQPEKPVVILITSGTVDVPPEIPEIETDTKAKTETKTDIKTETETETKTKTESGIFIMGKGRVDEGKLAFFLVQNSPYAKLDYAEVLAGLYIEEAAHEGIDHDVAFAQMCLETGFLSFGGLVQPEWNNFCGLGSIGPEQPGVVFPDLRTGVRAHIQHLKAYATSESLNLSLVDPRYRYVRLGSSPTIEGLAGTWAADRMYSEKIYGILQRLYAFAF